MAPTAMITRSSHAGGKDIEVQRPVRALDLTVETETQLLGDPRRRAIIGMDQGDQPIARQGGEGVGLDRPARFRGIAASPHAWGDDIDELDLRPSLDLLVQQAAMADHLS